MKKALIASTLFVIISASLTGQVTESSTAASVTELIIRNTGSKPVPNTVDVIKAGDPRTQVTGIVTCMFATMDVLRKAVEMKCNLIIPHEPLFYNHRDEVSQFINDPVYLEKKRFIDENGLVVWRFHDYVHSINPDAIDMGMAKKIGWEGYLSGGEPNRFSVPQTTVQGVLAHLKKVFPESTFHVVGDPSMKVSKVAFSAGAPGSQAHFRLLRDENIDLVIGGEVPQWETYEYARDAVSQGRQKAIIFLGHIPSEEAGMEYAATWMQSFIKNIPVHFVECKPSYWSF